MKTIIACLILVFCQVAFSADPQFSLHNKSLKNIEVFVTPVGQNEIVLQAAPDKFVDIQDLDTAQVNNVTILGENKEVLYVANILPGKTIYINWNPSRPIPLYPQRGPLLGFTGKTDLGYSTAGNVTAGHIKPVPECIKIKTEFGADKRGYRKASLKWHPDKCKTAECKTNFGQLASCYNIR